MTDTLVATRREKRIEIARALWKLPCETMPNTEISRRAGLSVTTLYRVLGRRSVAQKGVIQSALQNPVRTQSQGIDGDV
ncbi:MULTISPECIES: hypothetical protein [Acetobacter]|uniref:hypothetical protein n=1 Tax=Acetobacter TaxID=434 RepID=UPI0012E776D8|nr:MULTISPECIES: hypothetical protein [Acetobacter]MCP1232125.1 hypothetical protein [Acetobacter indonesiensis]